MTNSVVVFKGSSIEVTKDQYDTFVKSISTQSPTEAEIKLYLYDCDRRGVNPLDKLIYFTKRQGRYTPVISIDYMRIRAESSGKYAGSDDAEFLYHQNDKDGTDVFAAKITVWKIVESTRCSFSATARWSEYAPENLNDKSAFMWRKMPHTMLAKCAEALALRKAFPGQLAGLYAAEEMAQDGRYIEPLAVNEIERQNSIENESQDPLDHYPPEESTVLTGDANKDFPPVKFTVKKIRNSADHVGNIAKDSGKTVPDVLAFIKTLDTTQEYSIKKIVKLIKGEE